MRVQIQQIDVVSLTRVSSMSSPDLAGRSTADVWLQVFLRHYIPRRFKNKRFYVKSFKLLQLSQKILLSSYP